MLTDTGTKQLAKIAKKNGTIGPGIQVNEKELCFQAGCTATVALITQTEIYVANSGDTRAVLSSKGKAKDLSHDHKPDLITEKRRVERAGGFVEEGRVNGIIAISRAIGDMEYKNRSLKPEDNMVSVVPEVIVEPIKPEHDFLMIACDGIWDCMTS
jgi:protein phosphatase 2C family protein 2/3